MPTNVYITGGSPWIHQFELDPATGQLQDLGPVATGPVRAEYMAIAHDGRQVYGVGSDPNGQVRLTVYRLDERTGLLTKRAPEAVTQGRGGTHVALHPQGHWALVAHFDSGQISTLYLNDGLPSDAAAPVKTAPEAHQIVFDPTGRFVLVPCRQGNQVERYLFDSHVGKLTAHEGGPVPAPRPRAGPRHMHFHPQGHWAYLVNEWGGTVTTMAYDAQTGSLDPIETVSTVPPGVIEGWSAHILVHPSGRFLYVSNRDQNNLAVFAVDPQTGRLQLRGNENGGGLLRTPRHFTLTPNGDFLLAANQDSGTLVVFRVDPQTGLLSRAGDPVTGLGAPSFVGVWERSPQTH